MIPIIPNNVAWRIPDYVSPANIYKLEAVVLDFCILKIMLHLYSNQKGGIQYEKDVNTGLVRGCGVLHGSAG